MDNANAKSSWMKVVNKHSKKQKGLPALSTLNTDAGNVEAGINMFNSATATVSEEIDKTVDKLDDTFDMSMRTLL